MVSGDMVVLDQGDLATAMRASMAIPGAFAPVLIDNQVLSDGGLVRNIPIDVARELCADVVIVVNLVEPAADPAKLHSATQLLSRTMDVMIYANETLQLQTLRPDDVLINIEMGTIGTADFRARARDDSARRGRNARSVGCTRALRRARGAVFSLAQRQ